MIAVYIASTLSASTKFAQITEMARRTQKTGRILRYTRRTSTEFLKKESKITYIWRICCAISTEIYREEENLGCFIATTAYGSYSEPHVLTLRELRDNILSKSVFGRLFIRLYYKASPPVERLIASREFAKKVVSNYDLLRRT
jgi:hypothetical protein